MNDGVSAQLQNNLRRFREQRAWSLNGLARRAGLDPGTVRKVEAGGNATLKSLVALADALELPLSALLFDKPPRSSAVSVVRAADRSSVDAGAILVRHLAEVRSPSLVDVRHLVFHGDEPLRSSGHPPGTVERFFVLTGRIRVGPLGEEAELAPGDFATFAAESAHGYQPIDTDVAGVMLISRDEPAPRHGEVAPPNG